MLSANAFYFLNLSETIFGIENSGSWQIEILILLRTQRRCHPRDMATRNSGAPISSSLELSYLGAERENLEKIGINCEADTNNTLYLACNFVPHRVQNVLLTQHFVLWLLFPRILHWRRLCISRKIADKLVYVNGNRRKACVWPSSKRAFFCLLHDINNHEGDSLTLHVCISEEKILESVL